LKSWSAGSNRSSAATDRRLGADTVAVWILPLDAFARPLEEMAAQLDATERARAERFATSDLRRRFVVAHAALRRLLAVELGIAAGEIAYDIGPYGKPMLRLPAGAPDLRFNIAHSGELMACAIALDRELGVDIEWKRPIADFEDIARHYFACEEREALAALVPAQRGAAFYACWSRKEAYIKARGLGLHLPLDSFHVAIAPDARESNVVCRADQSDGKAWSLLSLDVGPSYAGALAVEVKDKPFSLVLHQESEA